MGLRQRTVRRVAASAVVVFVCGALCLLAACTRSSEVGLYPGDVAPEIVLHDLDKKLKRLSEYRGKGILLNFWASWCVPCIEEMPSLEKLQRRLGEKGFQVVTVAVDDQPDTLLEFRERFGLSFPILVDTKGEAKKQYKIQGYPETFFLDRDGKLIMFPDPENQMPTVRLIGPRQWDDPQTVAQIEQLVLSAG